MRQLLVAASELPAGLPSEQAHFFLASSLHIKGTHRRTLCGQVVRHLPYRAGPVNPYVIAGSEPYRFSCVACHMAVRSLDLDTIYVPDVIDPDSVGED